MASGEMGDGEMNDGFLYAARPHVPAGLREAVIRRLYVLRQRELEAYRVWRLSGTVAAFIARHRWLAIFALVLVLAACTIGVLRVGRLAFSEVEQLPTEIPNGSVAVPQRLLPVDEVLHGVAFEFGLPSWAPDGYVLSDEAMVTLPEEASRLDEAWQVWLSWRIPGDSVGRNVLLLAYPAEYEGSYPVPVGPGAVETVWVGGEKAAVVHGNWIGGKWEESMGGNVRWIAGETAYWLQSAWVHVDDLVKMASSVR